MSRKLIRNSRIRQRPSQPKPMFTLSDKSLEWALKHVTRFYSSDFFPAPFEFKAISDQWSAIKPRLESIDLDEYLPRTPIALLAPKPNGTFRVVHQLDPIDAIIYAALVFEISTAVENYRLPPSAEIACSYRIDPTVDGSFFGKANEWDVYTRRTKELSKKYKTGFVITGDFVDFYNQIYTHRIANLIEEAGGTSLDHHAKVIEKFLLALNTETSRGVPVGPAPSIVLSELVMADIDKKILNYTRDFVRWADDIRIFFTTREEAEKVLHELTHFIHSNHRLVFSGEKTRIVPVEHFVKSFKDEEAEEAKLIKGKAEEIALSDYYDELMKNLGPYEDPEDVFDPEAFQEVFEQIAKTQRFEILSNLYKELLENELKRPFPQIAVLRRIFKNASRYRIRSILRLALSNFDKLVPVVRELVLYLSKVIDADVVKANERAFRQIVANPRMQIPYINMWISSLLQHEAFGSSELPRYDVVGTLRDQALVARRRADRTWVKGYKNGLDILGPWEKRAVLYAASILSHDEMLHWLQVAAARGDIIETAVARYVISEKKEGK
jgi:Reverse transcriptase (RNA-dependent DNA polymerase)